MFHIQFEERLQELIMIKTGRRVGPEEEEEDEEESTAAMQEMGEFTPTIPGSSEVEESEEDSRRTQDVMLQYLNMFPSGRVDTNGWFLSSSESNSTAFLHLHGIKLWLGCLYPGMSHEHSLFLSTATVGTVLTQFHILLASKGAILI